MRYIIDVNLDSFPSSVITQSRHFESSHCFRNVVIQQRFIIVNIIVLRYFYKVKVARP
jgi:hypothetical protein